MKQKIKETVVRHAGVLVGSILGLLSGLHIFGLAIGALLGYFVDELMFVRRILRIGTEIMTEPVAGVLDDRWTRVVLSIALACGIAVLAEKEPHMGLAEKKLLEDRILRRIGIGGNKSGLVRQLTDRFFAVKEFRPLELASVYKVISDINERSGLLSLLFDAAKGESERITAEQNDLLKEVSIRLEIPAHAYNDLRSNWIIIDTDAYDILGIAPDVSDQEVQKVYRLLASQFHPDTGVDLDDTQREQSNEAFLKVKDAYNRIMADRNALRTDSGD